jgi:hypothetical protein
VSEQPNAYLAAIANVRGAGVRMAYGFDTKSKPGSVIIHQCQFHSMELPNNGDFDATKFTMLHPDNDLRLLLLAHCIEMGEKAAQPASAPLADHQMGQISIVLDPDHSGKEFDQLLHHSGAAKDTGDLRIVTKDNGTVSGKPIACIAFTAVLPDGKTQLVQTVTTVALLKATLAALNGRYP